MNSRERFNSVMDLREPDHVPYFEEGIREDVWQVWMSQGLDDRESLRTMFVTDQREEIELNVDPRPVPRHFPACMDELKAFENRFKLTDPGRLPEEVPGKLSFWKTRDHVLMLQIHRGFFITLGVGDWKRFYQVVELLKDDPALIHAILDHRGEFIAGLLNKLLPQVTPDAVIFSEPIGGNNGPIISPRSYEEFVLASYSPIMKSLREHGIKNIIVRTYANSRVLIPSFLKFGINCLWACEVNCAAMDYRSIRSEFGPGLRLIGGIDIDVLREGKDAIRREIEEMVTHLNEQGGYIPLADGRVRKDIPLENYIYYRQLLEKVTSA